VAEKIALASEAASRASSSVLPCVLCGEKYVLRPNPNLGLEMRGRPPWLGCDPGLRYGPESLSLPEKAEMYVFLAGSGRFQSQLGTGKGAPGLGCSRFGHPVPNSSVHRNRKVCVFPAGRGRFQSQLRTVNVEVAPLAGGAILACATVPNPSVRQKRKDVCFSGGFGRFPSQLVPRACGPRVRMKSRST
jgi:hypothetical protein